MSNWGSTFIAGASFAAGGEGLRQWRAYLARTPEPKRERMRKIGWVLTIAAFVPPVGVIGIFIASNYWPM